LAGEINYMFETENLKKAAPPNEDELEILMDDVH